MSWCYQWRKSSRRRRARRQFRWNGPQNQLRLRSQHTEKKAKDPKRVATGRAGAAARQKRLLEQLNAAKESLRPPVSAADNDGTSASPKEAKPSKLTDERSEPNWIPWIIGACWRGVHLRMSLRAKTCASGSSRAQSPGSPVEGFPRLPLYGIRPWQPRR